jgi:two-component system chemotaxis sensor kinase CheA
VAGQSTLYKLREDYIPIVRLGDLFGVPPAEGTGTEHLLMVVESAGQKIGLIVDALLGQQQVVIKSLETNFRRIEGVSGATILGDGTVALILDIAGLLRLAQYRSGTPPGLPRAETARQAA